MILIEFENSDGLFLNILYLLQYNENDSKEDLYAQFFTLPVVKVSFQYLLIKRCHKGLLKGNFELQSF